MARIGDYIDPSLNRYDPSPYLNAQSRSMSSIGQSISEGIGAVGDVVKDRREKKDTIKTSKALAEAMATLYPEARQALEPVIAGLDDEEMPLSERAALGARIGEFINMGVQKSRDNALLELKQREMAIQEGQFQREGEIIQRELDATDKATAFQEQNKQFIARPLLEEALRQTVAAERAGESPLINAERLKTAFLFKDPERQIQAAQAALAGLPQSATAEPVKIPITIDGQPAEAMATFNRKTGSFNVVPVQGAAVETDLAASLPAPLAPYASAFEAAGAKYGVDPRVLAGISMHETGNGTSAAFRNKNNAMGISDSSGPVAMESVEASIDRMARLLGSTESGPYKNAGTVDEVAGIYAPPKAGNDPGNLNRFWKSGVAANVRRLGGDPSAPIRITPGAVKGGAAAQTPAQARKEELEIAKLEADAAAAEKKALADAAASSANIKKLSAVADKYTTIDPTTGARKPKDNLRDVTGPFATVGKWVDKYVDSSSFAAKAELQRFVEADLLEATKDLKPVSEDEMKLLMSRRPLIDSPPEAWASYMDEVLSFIASKTPATAGQPQASPAQSAADRLRALKR